SAYGVVQRFQERGLRFPRRQYGGAWDGKLIWGRLTHSRGVGILANPSYTGTYVFGRHQSCKQIGPNGEIPTQSRPKPQDAWLVVIHDHHPGYLVSLAVATLLANGAAEPRRHLFLAAAGKVATLIVTKSPLSPVALTALKDAGKANDFTVLLSPESAA